jgi:polar amino acid transport system permease protein
MGYQFDFGKVLQGEYLELILEGLQATMVVFVFSWIIGLVLAVVLTVIRAVEFKPTQFLVAAFVEYHRNVPMLIQLFVWYFGFAVVLPDAVNDYLNDLGAEIGYAIVALALNKAAYMSEDFRSGLRSIHPAQMEAARSIGLTYLGAMCWVILPQAIFNVIPGIVNQLTTIIKESSLGSIIAVSELSYVMLQVNSNEVTKPLQIFGILAAVYFVLCFALSQATNWLERRISSRRTGQVVVEAVA